MGLRAIEPALAEQSAGADGDRRLRGVPTCVLGVLLGLNTVGIRSFW